MALKSAGYGREAYGDPFGGGGPISVVRALAVAGQVVRVTFSEEPLHRTPAGARDALNVANYVFSVVDGQATAPAAVGVSRDLVVGPAYGVGNGTDAGDERALDVHVDRQLVVGIRYRVFVKNVDSLVGGEIGAPYTADFSGVTLLQETQRPQRRQDLTDFLSVQGHWVIDDGGDVVPEPPQVDAPDVGIRKRVLRRLGTSRGAFSFLSGYGLRIPLKGVATTAKMSELRDEAGPQLRREPEAQDVSVSVSVSGLGVTTVDARIKTRKTGVVPVKLAVDQAGQVVSVG